MMFVLKPQSNEKINMNFISAFLAACLVVESDINLQLQFYGNYTLVNISV